MYALKRESGSTPKLAKILAVRKAKGVYLIIGEWYYMVAITVTYAFVRQKTAEIRFKILHLGPMSGSHFILYNFIGPMVYSTSYCPLSQDEKLKELGFAG